MSLYFITGNKNKFTEALSIIPDLEQLDLDLPEIQEIDPHEVIKAKLTESLKHQAGQFIVEDTAMYLDCLNGFPGPLIKWLQKSITNNGIVELTQKYQNPQTEVKTVIGYAKNKDEISFFEGVIKGQIVPTRGESSFGFDPIFQPDGQDKTFAEMSDEEKRSISMRRIAFDQLKKFIDKANNDK